MNATFTTLVVGSPRTRSALIPSRSSARRAAAPTVVSGIVMMRARFLEILLPAHRAKEPLRHRFRPPHVPVIVEAPDNEIVFLDQFGLALVDRIALELRCRVGMAVERRFVADDEVPPSRRSALENRHRRHDGRRNAANGRIWIAGLERVDGLGPPGDAELGLNHFDDSSRRQRGLLAGSGGASDHDACARGHELSSIDVAHDCTTARPWPSAPRNSVRRTR